MSKITALLLLLTILLAACGDPAVTDDKNWLVTCRDNSGEVYLEVLSSEYWGGNGFWRIKSVETEELMFVPVADCTIVGVSE